MSFTGFLYAQESEPLPLQPISNEQIVKKPEVQTTIKKDDLTDVEKQNIKEIYDKKLEYPQFELGSRYYFGTNGLTQDYKKAFNWFSSSSKDEQNPNADMMLASMYYEGKGLPVDMDKAIEIYSSAGEKNLLEAQLILTAIFFFDNQHMNQEKANYWIFKAIANKGKQAELLKSLILLKPEDYKSFEKFLPAFEKYAAYNDEMSQFILGYLYFTGKVLPQDFSRSIKYLAQSAVNRNPISIIMMNEIKKNNFKEEPKKEEKSSK